jgi:hypothetical protein
MFRLHPSLPQPEQPPTVSVALVTHLIALSRSPSSQSSCGFSLKVIWNLSIWGAYNNNDALLGGCAMSLPKSARNSDEQLFALLDEIVGRGDEPSVRTLHKAAGGGSYARLRKVFELWEKDRASSSAATGKDRRQEKSLPSTAAADQIDDGTAAEQDTGADSISDVASPGDTADVAPEDVVPAFLEQTATSEESGEFPPDEPSPSEQSAGPEQSAAPDQPVTADQEPPPNAASSPVLRSLEADTILAASQAEVVRLRAQSTQMQAEIDRLWGFIREMREASNRDLQKAFLIRSIMMPDASKDEMH